MKIKCLEIFRYIQLVLTILLFDSVLVSLAAQDGLVLGVQTTVNSSYLEDDAASSDLINFKEEGKVEEIHSSFEDTSAIREEVKKVDIFKSEPTLHFQHQHVNIATELSESGQAAVVYTLLDSELQTPTADVSTEPENNTHAGPVTITLSLSDARSNYTDTPPYTQESEEAVELVSDLSEEKNDTLPVAAPPAPPQEDIPSFSEWAQKQLAEAEKKKGENVTGSGSMPAAPLKARHNKNYASPDCGAKVVGANPEAVSAGSVLSSSRDEYLLNTCNARTWFIVELCEAIQPKKVEIANFELFSSSPREFSVSLSDRYPTRDWALAGRFTAQDERNLQAFNLSHTSHFGKYVKVEVHSHYGQEHYCPVSLFRVYGTSEIEVLDTVDEGHQHHSADDDDDDLPAGEGGEAPKNLFGSARDAVLSIVKKAAEALAKTPEGGRDNSSETTASHGARRERPQLCVTPAHIAVCVNCSDHFYDRMYDQMSCRIQMLAELLSSRFVRNSVTSSEFCADRGLDLRVGAPYPAHPRQPRPIDYLQALLPSETIAALCNLLAAAQKKVVLNGSQEQTPIDNGTVSDWTGADSPTPALPDVSSSCAADSNASQDSVVATRPPYEPPRPPTLPIRPSRTLPHDQLDNTSYVDVNITVEETVAVPPVVSDNSTNGSLPAERVTTDNLSLVVEDAGSLDSLFSELEQAVVPSPRVPPAPQKESVFVRLANRIKALERNMSLSSQYLEELSRRYKRQVEEMQRALATAIEDRRRGEEREGVRLEQMTQLTQQVETLTLAVKNLLEERDSWHHKATVMGQHGVIVIVEVLVFALVLYVCRWLPEVDVARRKFSVAWPRTKHITRRVSVDEALPNAPNRNKRRRPSDEACIIAAGNARKELLYQEGRRKVSKGESRRQRRKRKRELIAQQSEESVPEGRPGLLDNNSTESVSAWWEEEVFSPAPTLPPPPPLPLYAQTAVAQRQERIARTSSENSDKDSKSFLPIKKTGPFKKIVKKFF